MDEKLLLSLIDDVTQVSWPRLKRQTSSSLAWIES